MTSNKTSILAATAAGLMSIAAVSLPAFAVQSPEATQTQTGAAMPNPSVLVFNQKVDGKTIKLAYAFMPKNGFIVIYGSDASGKMTGSPLGSAAIPAGDHRDVKVTLTTEPKRGAKLWATLYEGVDGKANFDDKDQAVWKVSELPLQNMFVIE